MVYTGLSVLLQGALCMTWWSSSAGGTTCDVTCECQMISPNDVTVHCARKALSRIPWDIPANVTYLDVSYNNITALEGANIKELQRLRKLDLRNNLVSTIDSWAFQKLIALEELDLDNNLIQIIRPYMFSIASNLKILSLGNNAISRIQHSAFIHLSLDSLNLRDNRKLTSLDRATFDQSGVNTMILDGCGIIELDAGLFRPISGTLRVLSLSNMANVLRLRSGVFSELDLDILQLVGNNMSPEDIDFLATTLRVKSLDLSANKLIELDLSRLVGLGITESLMVKKSHVRRVFVSGDEAPDLSKIRSLDLSGNELTSFSGDLLRWLPSLRHLNVADNPIGSMTPDIGALLDRLETLDVSNISLSCSCELRWFAEWLNVTGTAVIGGLCSPADAGRSAAAAGGCRAPHALAAWVESNADDVGRLEIVCRASGNPAPRISLTRLRKTSPAAAERSVVAASGGGELHFRTTSSECCGYVCTAANRVGNDTLTFHVCPSRFWIDRLDDGEAGGATVNSVEVWILTIVLSVILLLLLLILCVIGAIRKRKSTLRKKRRERTDPDDATGSHMILMNCTRDEAQNSVEFS